MTLNTVTGSRLKDAATQSFFGSFPKYAALKYAALKYASGHASGHASSNYFIIFFNKKKKS